MRFLDRSRWTDPDARRRHDELMRARQLLLPDGLGPADMALYGQLVFYPTITRHTR